MGSSTNHVDGCAPYPCGLFNDPLYSQKTCKVPIYWNFKIQTDFKLFLEYLVANTIILYSSNSSNTCKFLISNVKMWEL